MGKKGIVQETNVKTNNYLYPFAKEFEDYLKSRMMGKRNIDNITSRINSLLCNGYTPKNSNTTIFFSNNFKNSLNNLPAIIKGPKKYHNLALQVLAAIFAILDDAIQNNPKNGTLRDIRSAFIHYYEFIEEQLSQSKGTRLKNAPGILSQIHPELNKYYGLHNSTLCFTQAEVRDNFIQRLHTQDRLYNHNLLYPIYLIDKLYGRANIVNGWTNAAINDIEIIISADKDKIIKFKDVSFILFRDSFVYVFDKNDYREKRVFSREYVIVEKSRASALKVHDPGQPLKSIAIDHRTPMKDLIKDHAQIGDVPKLQGLSSDFCNYINNYGQQYLQNVKNDWMIKHPYAYGLNILNSKTIKDLSTGYKNTNPCLFPNIIIDINQLHVPLNQKPIGFELMDSDENRKKGDS